MLKGTPMARHTASSGLALGRPRVYLACRLGAVPPTRQGDHTHQEAPTGPFAGLLHSLKRAGEVALPVALAMTVALSMTPAPAPASEPKIVRLPASSNPEIFAAQRTMVEAWTIVGESFVDPEFNALDWPEELRQHMIAAYTSEAAPNKAWAEINSMLKELGDPYTRRIEPDEYQAFRVSADGELQGIGLLIANELTSTGHLRVLAPIRGGPADRAGILPGDEVISINGEDTAGWTGDRAAKVLRGKGGTEVRVRLARRSEGIPGVPSRPEPQTMDMTVKEVALKRESVAISPVYSTLLSGSAEDARPVGYVRLSQFSGNAAEDMRKAVSGLKDQGAGRYILDLRSNPGGLVKAGVDVTAMWLDGEQTVFTVASRDAGTQVQTTETLQPALTHDPLVVLVDSMSASASEIVSGALHDNQRALIMGDTSTYGKGRIQSVFELQDGSALFVTVAKYQTPAGSDIDHLGIRPDLSCRPGSFLANGTARNTASAPPARNALGAPMGPTPVSYRGPAPPLKAAAVPRMNGSGEGSGFMPGVPLDASTESMLLEALSHDRCVLAAERYLATLKTSPGSPTMRPSPELTSAQKLYLAYIRMPGHTRHP